MSTLKSSFACLRRSFRTPAILKFGNLNKSCCQSDRLCQNSRSGYAFLLFFSGDLDKNICISGLFLSALLTSACVTEISTGALQGASTNVNSSGAKSPILRGSSSARTQSGEAENVIVGDSTDNAAEAGDNGVNDKQATAAQVTERSLNRQDSVSQVAVLKSDVERALPEGCFAITHLSDRTANFLNNCGQDIYVVWDGGGQSRTTVGATGTNVPNRFNPSFRVTGKTFYWRYCSSSDAARSGYSCNTSRLNSNRSHHSY